MKVKACRFDLDGTVLYTLESIALAGNRMLESMGYAGRPVEEYRYYCGDGSDNLVKRVLGVSEGLIPVSVLEDESADWTRITEALPYSRERIEAGSALNRRFLAEQPLYRVHPYEGMPEALSALKEMGLRLAVFSNKPDASAKAAIKGAYGGLFDHVQGQTEGIPIKPDPAGALLTAEALRADPSECVYFGDTWTDMRTGKSAGMYTAGVLWGYRPAAELSANGADALVRSPDEIPDLIRRLSRVRTG